MYLTWTPFHGYEIVNWSNDLSFNKSNNTNNLSSIIYFQYFHQLIVNFDDIIHNLVRQVKISGFLWSKKLLWLTLLIFGS